MGGGARGAFRAVDYSSVAVWTSSWLHIPFGSEDLVAVPRAVVLEQVLQDAALGNLG